MIFAQSPQANVLSAAGTFQDRLVADCGWPAQPPWSRQRARVCASVQPALRRSPAAPSQRSAWTKLCLGRFCVSSTAGRWTGTTRCGSSCGHSNCCRRRNAPAMPGRRWSPGLDGQLKVRHEGRIIAAQEAPPSPVSLRNGHQPPAVSPVAPIGVNHWDERWTAHLAPLVSSQEPAADQPDCTDGEVAAAPPATVADLPSEGEMDRGRDGRRSRKPGARACRCGQSNGSWASTGPPSGVIWRPEVLQDGSSGLPNPSTSDTMAA